MPSVISGDANVSATEFGYLDGVTSGLQSQIDSKLNLAGGKILQIVRATDGTNRSTTSTSDVDVTGMTVTITPQKSDSAVMILAVFGSESGGSSTIHQSIFTVTDSSNNSISGTQTARNGMWGLSASGIQLQNTLVGYATPATISAVTYKLRFRSQAATVTTTVLNGSQTGQMYAIEVSA